MLPFIKVPLKSRSALQIVFKQHPEDNAIIELNNLLASGDVLNVTEREINDIEDRYALRIWEQFPLNLQEFYAVYLNYCLKDSGLNDSEKDRLVHMRNLFSLTSQQIQIIHSQIGANTYEKLLRQSIANGKIQKSEEQLLFKLEQDLNLSSSVIKEIAAKVKGGFIKSHIDRMIAKQQISPEDEKQLELLARDLGVKLELTTHTQKMFSMLKEFWALEHLDLPTIDYKDVLQKGEVCYMKIPSVRMYDTPASQRQYGRNLNTAKEIYIKIASDFPNTYTAKKTYVANGDLYLTDKRIFFDGPEKNSYIKFEKVMSISAFSGGIRINKESGKIPYFEFSENLAQFCVVLERVVRESN